MNCRYPTFLGLALLTFIAACSDRSNRLEQPPVPQDPTRLWVEQLALGVDTELREYAEARATGDELESYLVREARRGWYDRIAGGIKYADLFQELYANRENRKAFAQPTGLTPKGEAVLDVLKSADEHALDPAPYHVARVTTLSAELARSSAEAPNWEPIQLTPEESERLIAWMKSRELDPHAPDTRRKVFEALLGFERVPAEPPASEGSDAGSESDGAEPPSFVERDLEAPPAPRIIERVSAFEDTFKRSAKLTAELELRVADGALRYARDMKHFNIARLDWRDIKKAGGSKKLIYGRLATTFGELVEVPNEKVAELFDALEPPHPQYEKLVAALARYRAIAAAGGWDKVRVFEFEAGTRHRRVPELRARLAREGFIEVPQSPTDGAGPAPELAGEANNAIGAAAVSEGSSGSAGSAGSAEEKSEQGSVTTPDTVDTDVIDEALLAAVKSYQESHQFRPTGKSSGGLWRSINVPVERRISQIELALQRWRESRYRNEADFIHVNIPDFHAEVWFDHERTMRFRVVTGNNQRKCNPKTKKWEYPNATPTQVANLDHLIFNPYWNVPKRIIDEEIRPAMKRDAKYLEKNHYEFVPTKNGREWVRQLPGDHNALGRVKFIFPNPHNTYMHDTPKKKYFDYSVRGFSHGCVRVQDPLDLATHLLEKDGKGDRKWIDEVIESERTVKVEFDRDLPVFFEYATVRVDDQGRTNFLADIYKKDRRRMSEDPEAFDDCSPRRARPPKDDGEEGETDGDDDAPAEADVGP